jgi:predicted secreted protein
MLRNMLHFGEKTPATWRSRAADIIAVESPHLRRRARRGLRDAGHSACRL